MFKIPLMSFTMILCRLWKLVASNSTRTSSSSRYGTAGLVKHRIFYRYIARPPPPSPPASPSLPATPPASTRPKRRRRRVFPQVRQKAERPRTPPQDRRRKTAAEVPRRRRRRRRSPSLPPTSSAIFSRHAARRPPSIDDDKEEEPKPANFICFRRPRVQVRRVAAAARQF